MVPLTLIDKGEDVFSPGEPPERWWTLSSPALDFHVYVSEGLHGTTVALVAVDDVAPFDEHFVGRRYPGSWKTKLQGVLRTAPARIKRALGVGR